MRIETTSIREYVTSWLVAFVQSKCKHNGDIVRADLLQGDAVWRHDNTNFEVPYCSICGSVKIYNRPNWEIIYPITWVNPFRTFIKGLRLGER